MDGSYSLCRCRVYLCVLLLALLHEYRGGWELLLVTVDLCVLVLLVTVYLCVLVLLQC